MEKHQQIQRSDPSATTFLLPRPSRMRWSLTASKCGLQAQCPPLEGVHQVTSEGIAHSDFRCQWHSCVHFIEQEMVHGDWTTWWQRIRASHIQRRGLILAYSCLPDTIKERPRPWSPQAWFKSGLWHLRNHDLEHYLTSLSPQIPIHKKLRAWWKPAV